MTAFDIASEQYGESLCSLGGKSAEALISNNIIPKICYLGYINDTDVRIRRKPDTKSQILRKNS